MTASVRVLPTPRPTMSPTASVVAGFVTGLLAIGALLAFAALVGAVARLVRHG